MQNALISFKAELDKLDRFLGASDAEDLLIAVLLRSDDVDRADIGAALRVIQDNRTIIRRQSYVSSIIVMYGALERFVEEVVQEYTEALVEICKEFHHLPAAIRERHTQLTIDYLALLKDGKVRETEEMSSIVATLHACLNGGGPFRLNARAFSLRSSNMNLKRIREIMRSLEVDLRPRRMVLMATYTAFLSEGYGISVIDMKENEIEGALDHIDQLVSLRNDIAHGVVNIESIEDKEIVRERASKLMAFATTLNEILICELLSIRIALKDLVPVQGDVHVFGDHVACFAWPVGRLVPGDYLVMRPAGGASELRHGPIASIEIDRVDQTEVEGQEGLMIGVCVPFKVKANGTFYVWHCSAT